MAKKPKVDLSAALDAVEKEPEAPQSAPAPPRRSRGGTKPRKPSREGTVLVGAHFEPAVQKQLRIIAAEEGTSNKALIAEALNMLFVKKNKPKISI